MTNAVKFNINYYLVIARGSGVHKHFSLISFADCHIIYDETALFPKHQRIYASYFLVRERFNGDDNSSTNSESTGLHTVSSYLTTYTCIKLDDSLSNPFALSKGHHNALNLADQFMALQFVGFFHGKVKFRVTYYYESQ